MSVRRKLILSYLLVFLIPALVGLIVLGSTYSGFDRRYGPENDYNRLRMLAEAAEKGDTEEIQTLCAGLESPGELIRFAFAGDVLYESDMFGVEYKKIAGDTFVGGQRDFMSSGPGGSVSMRSFELRSGRAELTSLNRMPRDNQVFSDNFVEAELPFIKSSLNVAVLSVILGLILTISASSWLISRSILRPLRLLREGTREIKSGNLDHSLIYVSEDEFGEVCADFEDMRLGLKRLKEEERRYEDNRKELIAGITHDLNTPLTSIRGFTSGLLDGIVNTPDKRETYLRNIKQTVDGMSKLVEELLLYSTLDMDGVAFSFTPIELNEYFADCVSELRDVFRDNGMELYFSPSDSRTIAAIDCMHFRRVVLNILWNSARYKKNDVGRVLIDLKRGGNTAVIRFRDDGIGVTATEAEDIFRVFYRSDKSRSKETGGSGLGLVIVRRIIEAHGGSVRANPDYTGGLEIVVELPIKD